MGLRFWLFLFAAAAVGHFILYLADREISIGVDRLSEERLVPGDVLDTDPELKLVTARSPYMRDER
jgi:hypothetical protein